jgi:cytochrome c-type biogenesis protein CcmH/NrfG
VNPDRLAELEEERRFLLRSIGDLDREREAGDVDEHDYVTLRDGYVARAAAVLREIEDGKAALPGKRRRPRVIVGAVVATLAIATLAGWMVAHYSGQRTESSAAAPLVGDEISQQLARARVAFSQQDSNTAVDAYKRVLQLDPNNVEATTYAGWLIVTSGFQSEQSSVVDIGVGQIRRAISIDPTYPDAHCLLGVALARFVQAPDPAGAQTELTTCLANNPPAEVRQLVGPVLASLDPTASSVQDSNAPVTT